MTGRKSSVRENDKSAWVPKRSVLTAVLFHFFFFAVLLTTIHPVGCSSSGDGGPDNDSDPGIETYTTSGSNLVLRIPDSLTVSQDDIAGIHAAAENVSHCYTTNREPVDIVLAEACIAYNSYYLYPQFFPPGLDSIKTVASYVSYLQSSDPFTFYLSPEDYGDFISFIQGSNAFIGLSIESDGVTISERTPLVVTHVAPFTRAWIDGFQTGDNILEIDGVPLRGMSFEDARLLFPSSEEEAADVTVERDGVEIVIHTAAEENIALRLYQDLAYLSVRSFTETTGVEFMADFDELRMETGDTINKLILDLRDNAGGSISGTLELVDYLVEKDDGSHPIMTVRGPANPEETRYLGDYNEFDIGNFDETNFVLLVDENSASASEIAASVLKHYGTAYLIGENTYGKGVGQYIIPLIDESGVVVTSFESLTPSGGSYHLVGVSPDFYLDAVVSSFDDDPVLDAAVLYLNSGNIIVAASGNATRKHRIAAPQRSTDPLMETFIKRNRSGDYY